MTFYTYMKRFAEDYTAFGDLSRDMIEDVRICCEEMVNLSPEEWRDHIEIVNDSDNILDVLDLAIENYKYSLIAQR